MRSESSHLGKLIFNYPRKPLMEIILCVRAPHEFDLVDSELFTVTRGSKCECVSAPVGLRNWKALKVRKLSNQQRLTEVLEPLWSQLLQEIVHWSYRCRL